MTGHNRWQLAGILDMLDYRRVTVLTGARQCGKTTLAKSLPKTVQGADYRTLDSLQVQQSATNDPEGFVAHDDGLMIIDEIQKSPLLVQAIKKDVDENQKYGRFLLTGSANIQAMPSVNESMAGRVGYVRLRPLCMGERLGKNPDFVKNAFKQKFNVSKSPDSTMAKDDYIRLALVGGYPEAISLPPKKATKWHRDYVSALVERDLKDIINIHRKDAMRLLLKTLASWSTKEMNIQGIGAKLSIERPTLETYINALEILYLIDRLPSWGKTDYSIVRKKDKLLMTDTGVMASVLGWTFDTVQFDGERNGRLLENFVYQELMCTVDADELGCEVFYYRDANKREIDFIIQSEQHGILGLEIKAGSAVKQSDFKHLAWFRDTMAPPEGFVGIILYTGNEVLPFGKNLWAVPIRALW